MQRVILYRGGSCNEVRVLEGLKKTVREVYVINRKCDNYDADAALAEEHLLTIHQKKAEAVFSVDYYPILAEVAHVAGIPYVSWIIDAPHYTLYSPTSRYDTTFIFHFDREEAERLSVMGRPNVFHCRLATDADHFSNSIKKNGRGLCCDVAFLGRSYQDEHDYFRRRDGLSEYISGYCEGLMNAQHSLYGAAVIEASLTETICSALLDACDIHIPENYDIPEKLVVATLLEKNLSVRERRDMVAKVADRFGITLYSDTEKMVTKGVRYAGYADYETQMASAFYNSRINLNLTLRQIHSGIPLRALDIMGSGGFLLSNWQPELAECFEDGRDLVLYGCEEEMLDKIGWYLEHEDERARIAGNGRDVVAADFTYEAMLMEMFRVIGGNVA